MVEKAPDPVLDYRFGWRWLLPISDSSTVALLGFNEEERAFWVRVISKAIITDDPARATVWLVQDVRPHRQPPPPALQTLCVIGAPPVIAAWRGWLVGRFATMQDYGMLPAANPRVVIPLGSPRAMRQALALHSPGRRLARLAVWAVGLFARLGWDRLLRGRCLCIASQTASVLPMGVREASMAGVGSGAPTAYALCLGNPELDRKTVVLPLDGLVPIILKVGETPAAQAALCNEAGALQSLALTPLACQVPRLVKLVKSDHVVTIHQEFRPRRAVRQWRMDAAPLEFLSQLSHVGRAVRPLSEVLKTLLPDCKRPPAAASDKAYARVRAWLEALALKGDMVWGHRSHGDFAPWNCAWTAQGWFVYDWEASQVWDVALGDIFYYVVAPSVLVDPGFEAGRITARSMATVNTFLSMADLPISRLSCYWSLWLLQQYKLQHLPRFGRLLEYQARSL